MSNIAFDYDVSKSRISDAVKWVENTLIQDGTFALPSKRELLKEGTEIIIVIVDATECETERPQKKEKVILRQAKMPHHKGPGCD